VIACNAPFGHLANAGSSIGAAIAAVFSFGALASSALVTLGALNASARALGTAAGRVADLGDGAAWAGIDAGASHLVFGYEYDVTWNEEVECFNIGDELLL